MTAAVEMLKRKEVADIVRVHVNTVDRWIKRKRLRAFRRGGVVRIRRKDLDDFLSGRKVKG